MKRNSLFLLAFTSLAFGCVVEGTAWNLMPKSEQPIEESTTDADSKPTAEPSWASELLSILEFGLECATEHVKDWKKQEVKCEEMQRQMDAAMESYKVSRKQNDAAEVLELVGTILDLDPPCIGGATDSAYANAIFIARDKTGLANHDKPDETYKPDRDSKAYELGRLIGDFIAKHFWGLEEAVYLSLLKNIF